MPPKRTKPTTSAPAVPLHQDVYRTREEWHTFDLSTLSQLCDQAGIPVQSSTSKPAIVDKLMQFYGCSSIASSTQQATPASECDNSPAKKKMLYAPTRTSTRPRM